MAIASHNQSIIKLFAGKKIISFGKIIHIVQNTRYSRDAFLQLTFSDGSIVLLTGSGDGDTLKIETSPWNDPFSGELSRETQVFIEKSGKRTLIDVTQEPIFHQFVDEIIEETYVLVDESGKLRGISIETGKYHMLTYVFTGDEGHIYIASDV